MPTKYTEFACITHYSFLRGASHPEEMIQTAAALGYQGLAITDECSFAGIVKAYMAAKKIDFPLIIGSEFHLEEGIHLIALANDKAAYSQISRLITHARRLADKGDYSVDLKLFNTYIKTALVIFCPNLHKPITDEHLRNLLGHQTSLWLGLCLTLETHQPETIHYVHRLKETHQLPWVAVGKVLMHHPERHPLFTTLNAIRLHTQVDQLKQRIPINAQQHLRSLETLSALYPEDALAETQVIQARCNFCLSQIKYEYPKALVPKEKSATQHLQHLVAQGTKVRWPNGPCESVQAQIEYELKIIAELKYEYYFLTVHQIVSFARSKGILCQGRGSAANSVVCFCLGITEVDPHKVPVLFERFISKERNEPPDIDVDFEHQRREEVIQFIYQNYGRNRAALAAALVTYRRKSAMRDVGKALGLSQHLINRLCQNMAWWDKPDQIMDQLQALNLIDKDNPSLTFEYWVYLVKAIIGFPRHLTQHVGGFVISHEPLEDLVPIEQAAMENRTLIQWDKDDLEALGFLKIDVLALGMLSAIKGCFNLITDYRKVNWTMATIPQEDPKVYEMLSQGDSIGVFQVESRAQMSMLPRLKPKTYYDLVVEVAIVRPGPIQGNMVHPYLKRRNGLEPISYGNKALEKVLKRTLGIPIFQEQVIQLAMVAADFTPGEADQLRRSMASWRKKGELKVYQDKLRQGLLAQGHDPGFADQVIEQINGFGEYGFPESHAASFALLVYVSAWLKYHEPSAFYCALLNAQPMGFYSASQLIQDAKRHKTHILPIDIRYSSWDHQLEDDAHANSQDINEQQTQTQPCIRLGFRLIKGFQATTAKKIEQLKSKLNFNTIQSLQALADRAQLSQHELSLLADANALSGLVGHRHLAHWQVQGVRPFTPMVNHNNTTPLEIELEKPNATASLIQDYQSMGLSIDQHPMQLLRNHIVLKQCKAHKDLRQIHHRGFVRLAGLVTNRQRPGTAKGTLFLTLEDETGSTNIIVWRHVLVK